MLSNVFLCNYFHEAMSSRLVAYLLPRQEIVHTEISASIMTSWLLIFLELCFHEMIILNV